MNALTKTALGLCCLALGINQSIAADNAELSLIHI